MIALPGRSVLHLFRSVIMRHQVRVYAGYNRPQGDYPALTPWPKGNHL